MKRTLAKVFIAMIVVAIAVMLLMPSSIMAYNNHNWCNCHNGQDGEDGTDGQDGIDGQNGSNGSSGQDGRDGKNGSSGRDVIRMFSVDGEVWTYESHPEDNYMLETNIYKGQVTHLIFDIDFVVIQSDGSLVFKVK